MNQSELAGALGISRTAVRKMTAKPDCPVQGPGPWPSSKLEEVKRWRAELRSPPTGTVAVPRDIESTNRAVETKLKLERMLKVKLEREILQGEWVSREDVERGRAERIRYFRESLENWPAELAAPLAALTDPRDVQSFLADRISELLDEYGRQPRQGEAA